jgi:hypothetical protein
MPPLLEFLDRIEKFKKQKQYDLAWSEANRGLAELMKSKGGDWCMMYYQMADILAREEKWLDALEKMGLCIHYLGGLGGTIHEKFVLRLLGKIGKKEKLNDYLDTVKKSQPGNLAGALKKLLV